MPKLTLSPYCKRLGLSLATLFVLVVPLVGCSVLAPTPTPEPVTIRFAVEEVRGEDYEALARAFKEEYPYITVEISSASNPDIDVFLFPVLFQAMLQQGVELANLDPYIEGDPAFEMNDLLPQAVEMLRTDGRLLGIPLSLDIAMGYYNQDLFDAYGVPYPQPGWTWNDFELTAGAVSHPQDGVFGYALVDPAYDLLGMIYAHGGWILDDVSNPTRVTFDDPAVAAALERYVDMVYVYNIIPTPDQAVSLGLDSVAAAIYQNKVGVWFGWISERGGGAGQINYPAQWPMRWGMVTLPQDRRASTLAQVNALYLAAGADHPQACWQWISFLSKQMPSRYLPVRQSQIEDEKFVRVAGENAALLARKALADMDLISPSTLQFGPELEVFISALQSVVGGRATVEEALQRAQQAAERRR